MRTGPRQIQTGSTLTSERFFGAGDFAPTTTSAPPIEVQAAIFTSYVPQQRETLRIIVQQALKEQRELLAKEPCGEKARPAEETQTRQRRRKRQQRPDFPRHAVLDWVADIFRLDFSMTANEIDYELEGYLSAQNLDLPPDPTYSPQTLQIWRAFTGSRKQWASTQEERLRAFVGKDEERQVVFEYVPPAERYLLHCLAADFGLVSESFGEDPERAVKISKTPVMKVLPVRSVEEVVRRIDAPPFYKMS